MLPVKAKDANVILRAPEGWDDGDPHFGACGSLPVRRSPDGFQMVSHWKPSDEELARLNAGGLVELCVVAQAHPVVALGVVDPELEAYGYERGAGRDGREDVTG